MDVLLDSAFDRLLSKYERTFGEQPPFSAASAEEVVSHMRRRMRGAFAAELPHWAGKPAGASGPGVSRMSQ